MRFPFRSLTLFVVIFSFFAVVYVSCNKDNNTTSSTVTKCVTCANGGACINDTCRCPAGYEGVTCQTLSFEKFINEWTVSETGSVTGFENPYQIEIEESSSSISSVIIFGLYEPYYPFGGSITATINADSIFIPSQQFDSGYIVGNGYYTPNTITGQATITMRYQVTNTTTHTVNDFGYSSSANSPSIWTEQ